MTSTFLCSKYNFSVDFSQIIWYKNLYNLRIKYCLQPIVAKEQTRLGGTQPSGSLILWSSEDKRMNIEIANRLVELRKKMGFSQEELADKLGLSRQAVSKWERAEASPDTDNLICLAKLYGVSLDTLLDTEQSIEDIAREVKEKKEDIGVSKNGIHLVDNEKGEEVVIDNTGVHAYKDGKEVDRKELDHESRGWKIAKSITFSVLMFSALITYILLGVYVPKGWAACWVIILIPMIIDSILSSISHRDPGKFAMPLVAVAVYIPLSFYFHIWHPLWVVFLTIPLYYGAVSPFTKHDDDEDKDEKGKDK